MFWPLSLLLLCGAMAALHLIARKKWRAAVAEKELELDHLRHSRTTAENRFNAQQRALFNSMIEGLLLIDNDGRIQLSNRALESLFDVSSDLRGKTILEAFRNHQLAALVDRLKNERQVRDCEIQLSEVQSRSFAVNAATIVDASGARNGSIFVFHDLTRLKQLENMRQDFVANVSHELRTPLSMIKGYVETLLDGAKDNPDVAEKFLQTIERHADRLTFLIEDLLTISKLESGQLSLNFVRCELAPMVTKVLQDLQSRADSKNLRLENQIPPGLSAVADQDRLEQVFWNLVDNAIKYGKQNGVVQIRAWERDEGSIEVSIRDDGPGIPLESQPRIFERFYRVDKARSREQGGTGLGLAIVKHVVQAHGGEVRVESGPASGSVFYFHLPARSSAAVESRN